MLEKNDFHRKLKSVLRYPEMIEAIADVLEFGIQKGYPDENWLKPEGKTMSRKSNFDSKNHHAAKHFSGELLDESGLYHLAHEGVRSLMELTRLKRNIIHPDDKTVLDTIEDFEEDLWKCRDETCSCHIKVYK